MTLHFSQRGLTDAETFTAYVSSPAPEGALQCHFLPTASCPAGNPAARMIVAGKLHSHSITGAHAQGSEPRSGCKVCEYLLAVRQLNLIEIIGQRTAHQTY
jgi:hypothetical protein